jgi:DNA-binding response OmpR family regulator
LTFAATAANVAASVGHTFSWRPRGKEIMAESTPVVLVADDEPSTLALVAAHVRGKGYEVLEASDGDEAWQHAQEHLPDLIVLDVMMPGMSGWEVCRKVRDSVSLAHTAIVMLTGIGEHLNEMTSPLYGADSYIDKPFDFGELDTKIAEALAARRGEAPAPEPEGPPAGGRKRKGSSNGASVAVPPSSEPKATAKPARAARQVERAAAAPARAVKRVVRKATRAASDALEGVRSSMRGAVRAARGSAPTPAGRAGSKASPKETKKTAAAARKAQGASGTRKAPAGKGAGARPGAAKAGKKTAVGKKSAPKKTAVGRKSAPKKTAASKKSAPKKTAASKKTSTGKKTAPKKTSGGKKSSAPKKTAPKKTSGGKKSAPKKTFGGKSGSRKGAAGAIRKRAPKKRR